MTADGKRAVSASFDKTLKVWDVEGGHELRTLEGHSDVVEGVARSADGRWAVSASGAGRLEVWDMERGRDVRTWQGHVGPVDGIASVQTESGRSPRPGQNAEGVGCARVRRSARWKAIPIMSKG